MLDLENGTCSRTRTSSYDARNAREENWQTLAHFVHFRVI